MWANEAGATSAAARAGSRDNPTKKEAGWVMFMWEREQKGGLDLMGIWGLGGASVVGRYIVGCKNLSVF